MSAHDVFTLPSFVFASWSTRDDFPLSLSSSSSRSTKVSFPFPVSLTGGLSLLFIAAEDPVDVHGFTVRVPLLLLRCAFGLAAFLEAALAVVVQMLLTFVFVFIFEITISHTVSRPDITAMVDWA